MKKTSQSTWSKNQQSGMLFFITLIVLFQVGLYYKVELFAFFSPQSSIQFNAVEIHRAIYIKDSVNDSKANVKQKIYPFNPNFITDYKGYTLGMSVEEIERLHTFRAQNKWVNSIQDFKNVTKVHDTLLNKISPYFKFPDWVKNQKASTGFTNTKSKYDFAKKDEKIIPIDVNQATSADFEKVRGIGPTKAKIILQEREKLGSFLTLNQLQYIWGIDAELFSTLKQHFFIDKSTAQPIKIPINSITIKELSKIPFFNYYQAKEVLTIRSMNNGIKSIEDLTKINDLSTEKLQIIALYLEY